MPPGEAVQGAWQRLCQYFKQLYAPEQTEAKNIKGQVKRARLSTKAERKKAQEPRCARSRCWKLIMEMGRLGKGRSGFYMLTEPVQLRTQSLHTSIVDTRQPYRLDK